MIKNLQNFEYKAKVLTEELQYSHSLAHVCEEKIEKICKCHNKFIFVRILITRNFVNSYFVSDVDNNEDKPQIILECKIL